MMLLSGNPALLIPLLALLIYSSYSDIRTRKSGTVYFLAVDIFLFGFYLYFDTILTFFIVPLLFEYFLKERESLIPYALVFIPLIHAPSAVAVSMAITILLVKIAFPRLGMGSGDMKIMQTVAIAVPTYARFPLMYSIASPGLVVIAIAAGSMLVTLGIMKSTIAKGVEGWPRNVPSGRVKTEDGYKYRVKGETASYLGPFVPCITIGYTVLLLLLLV
ncbi:MAG: hypothetical protein AMDU3_IPLC00004G0018 [Thermoplasmatales archaeon I-plasma]|jgi:hypothetical protein|nr:MAG: hypothetical protein AMDU3_IPLC00004G0018 [Thermoplasmatales archaeon I-plasma]